MMVRVIPAGFRIAFVIVLILAAFAGGWYVYVRYIQKPVIDKSGFRVYTSGQQATVAGYTIFLSRPRYRTENGEKQFLVNIELRNASYAPFIETTGTCDVTGSDGTLLEEGVGMELSEYRAVYPGETFRWTAWISLPHINARVGSCTYAPAGVYDPKLSVRFRF